MTFEEYQHRALQSAIYPPKIGLAYTALGLAGEAGEVANKVKKVYRDDKGDLSVEAANVIAREIGDVLWYCAALSAEIGISLPFIASQNLRILAERKRTNTLRGSGDDRGVSQGGASHGVDVAGGGANDP